MTTTTDESPRRRRAGLFWGGAGLLVLGVGLGVALQFSPATAATSAGKATTQPAATPTKCGNCQGNSGKGGGNGAGTGNPAKALVVTGDASDDLAPGRDAVLTVSVTNPNSSDVTLTSVEGRITGVTPTGTGSCLASWISIAAGGQGTVVPRGQTRDVLLSVRLQNLADTNQDGCKGASYSFALTANGRQA